MAPWHQEAAKGRWRKFSLAEQLANVGSEISRAKNWQGKDGKIFWGAVERALELFDLTLDDSRWRKRLKEIGRAREIFCGAVLGDNEYDTTLEDLERYFFNFAVLTRRKI